MAHDFMLAYRNELHGATAWPKPAQDAPGRCLELTVLFTGLTNTLRALDKAAELAHDLNAHIRLVVPQVVPYPLALESPPVLLEFNKNRFRALAQVQRLATCVEIFLCRDAEALLDEILPAHSTVVIGGRRRWWPTAEERLARRLHKQGHETIFACERAHEREYVNA
jgi:hypothetical protein